MVYTSWTQLSALYSPAGFKTVLFYHAALHYRSYTIVHHMAQKTGGSRNVTQTQLHYQKTRTSVAIAADS